MEKRFFDVFSKYNPAPEKRELLERGYDARFRYTKAPMRVEVEMSFASHEDAELIYEIEDECREFYGAESFKILPHFPSHEFNISRFGEITAEAALCGAVTNGFFSNAVYEDDGETKTATLPFSIFGIDFVNAADTAGILSNILYSRYGVRRKIKICSGDNAEAYEAEWRVRREQMILDAERESREAAQRNRENAAREREEQARAADPHYDFEKRAGISSVTGTNEKISNTEFRMGGTVFDASAPEMIWGEDFGISDPIPLADIEAAHGNAVFMGTVFSVETKEARGGTKTTVTIGISDGASAVYMKKSLEEENLGWVKGFKPGGTVAAFGRVIRDKFDNEPFLSFRGIKKIKKKERMDNAEEKRVELHLHSNMSQMDAVITPVEIVHTAIRWGHKAIAVTDH